MKKKERRINLSFPVIFFILILGGNFICNAQKKLIPDTLRFKNESAGLVFYTDIRNSFVLSDLKDFFVGTTPVTIYGGAVGIEFKAQHQFSVGAYTLTKKAERRLAEIENGVSGINQRWGLSFASLGYTYTFYDKGKFEFKLPFELGFGAGKIQSYDNLNNLIDLRKGFIMPFQVGIISEWRVTKYVGLKASLGYRKTIKGSIFRHNFDSPYYSLGLSFYYANIWKGLQKLFGKKNKDNQGSKEEQLKKSSNNDIENKEINKSKNKKAGPLKNSSINEKDN